MSISLQTKTVWPGTSEYSFGSEGLIEIFADSEFDALEKVNVQALPNSYVKPAGKVPAGDVKYDGTDFNVKQYEKVDLIEPNWKAKYINFKSDWAGAEIIIPEGTTRIAPYKFRGSIFKKITIPSSVISIGNYAFLNAGTSTNKITLTFLGITPPTITFFTFNSANINKIYVPAESVNAYKTASGWSSVASYIEAIPEP